MALSRVYNPYYSLVYYSQNPLSSALTKATTLSN